MLSLTPAAKRRISEDWNNRFPEMGVYEPMHLLRRAEPLLIGIVLERDSSNRSYRPTFHVHNLSREFPVISLTLAHSLRTRRTSAPETIDVQYHEAKYQEAATRLSRQAPLPFGGDLSLSVVLDAYQDFLGRPTTHYQPQLFEDMALLSAWASRVALAAEWLDEAHSRMESWPREVLDELGGLEAWTERLANRIADPDGIQETIVRRIEALGVQDIPVGRLVAI